VATNELSTVETDLARDIPHELAHLYLYKAVGDGYDTMPLWLDEGLASLVEEESDMPRYEAELREAVSTGDTISIADLCYGLPADEDTVLLAYAQSESFVRYVLDEYGYQALRRMIEEVGDGANCQEAPLRALGVPLSELEKDWLEHEVPQTTLGRIWQNGRVWFIIIVAGFLLAGLLARVPKGK
jgi:hypothetical protein